MKHLSLLNDSLSYLVLVVVSWYKTHVGNYLTFNQTEVVLP